MKRQENWGAPQAFTHQLQNSQTHMKDWRTGGAKPPPSLKFIAYRLSVGPTISYKQKKSIFFGFYNILGVVGAPPIAKTHSNIYCLYPKPNAKKRYHSSLLSPSTPPLLCRSPALLLLISESASTHLSLFSFSFL